MPLTEYTGARNALNDAGWQELARLVQAGTDTREMGVALGLSRNHVSKLARRVREALGIKHHLAVKREALVARIGELLNAGGTNETVAAELGIDRKAVSLARRELGLAQPTYLRLDQEEYAEVDRRLIAGERPRAVAEATGAHLATVSKRATAIKHLIPTDFPPCRCGRPHNHTGGCRLDPDKVAYIREQLTAGRRMEWIAPEIGISVRALRDYALPMIAELQAAGVKCGCGREVSHGRPYCHETHRWDVDPVFQEQVRALIEQGMARLTIAKHLGCSFPKVNRAAKPILAEMAAAGVLCGCGQPINHGKTCMSRGGPPTYRGYAYSKAARTIPLNKRYRAVNLAKAGHGNKAICDKLGLNEYGVTALLKDLGEAGKLPPLCVCGLSYGHRGGCRPVVKVKAPKKSKNRPWMKRPKIEDKALEKRMFDQWRKGLSLKEISRTSGVPFSTVQRLGEYWRSRKVKPPIPCVCGRPFRHSGGCIRNTPGAVTRLEGKRIERRVLAGILPHKVADELRLTVATVMKHSLALRDQLFADGVTCACGRRIAHNGWCSAKWDDWEMPRGFRPIPRKVQRQVQAGLLRGEVVADIAAAAGIGADRVWGERRQMSEADRRTRTLAIRERIKRDDVDGEHITRAIEQALPSDFGRLLPRDLLTSASITDRSWLAKSIRAGVINELFLAITEGRVEIEQIPDVVKSFVGRGLREWASLNAKSLDDKLGADGNATFGDLVGDTTAALAIEEITIGEDA